MITRSAVPPARHDSAAEPQALSEYSLACADAQAVAQRTLFGYSLGPSAIDQESRVAKRQVEVFTADCPVCEPTVKLVEELACSNCDEVTVYDLNFLGAVAAIEQYAIKTLPAVVVDGRLVACSAERGYDREQLLAAGVGQPLE